MLPFVFNFQNAVQYRKHWLYLIIGIPVPQQTCVCTTLNNLNEFTTFKTIQKIFVHHYSTDINSLIAQWLKGFHIKGNMKKFNSNVYYMQIIPGI